MPFPVEFTLRERPTMPGYGTVPENYSRHHVVGQKYLQLLYEMGRQAMVAPGTLERFARKQPVRPETEMSDTARDNWRKEVFGAFVWSPYGLFVGPKSTLRVFDPSDGVEQQRPLSFPEERWTALKAIPLYLEKAGVDLTGLRNLSAGTKATWTLEPDQDALKAGVTELIKGVAPATWGDHEPPPIHGMNPEDWALVKATDVKHFDPQTPEDVVSAYERYRHLVVTGMDFDQALALGGYRALLISPRRT